MKRRILEDINYIETTLMEVDDGSGKKHPFLLLNNMVADKINANKRRYPFEEVKNALVPFTEDVLNGLGSAIMLADHPLQGLPPSVKDAAGLIKEVYLDTATKTVKTKVQLLDNTQGNNILAIVKAGGRVGVSSRGMGSLVEQTENGEVYHEVKDFKLKGFDFVMFPSLGADAASEKLVFEHLQEEIKKIFPSLTTDLQQIKESVDLLHERIASDDLDSFKTQLLNNLISCGCKSNTSDVLINMKDIKEDTEVKDTLEKEEVGTMKTIVEFQTQYPELYKELVDKVTVEVTDTVTKTVTEKVTADVTESVTKEVAAATATEIKTQLESEIRADAEKKVAETQTALDEAQKKVVDAEAEITTLKESTQPYIDIVEGLVTFMREKKILITENEVITIAGDKAEVVDDLSKKVNDEMIAVINEQKAKLDEALARITALETEKETLTKEKAEIEEAKKVSEVKSAIESIVAKEPKYAGVLRTKLERATTVEEVESIYKTEKEFIDVIEKANKVEPIPAGDGTVKEEERVDDAAGTGSQPLTEAMTAEQKLEVLKDYQRKLAGIKS